MTAAVYHGEDIDEKSNNDCAEVPPTNDDDVLIHSEQSELNISCDDETSRSAQLLISSSSSLSSVSFDDEKKDIELVNALKKWALKHNTTRQCINDIL